MTTARATRRTSVWVLPLDTGGCGACAQSIAALHAPRSAAALRAQGVRFARSPRHADIILITGALTTAAREAAQAVLDGVPHPRVLLAIGDCALSGCVFAGSPYLAESAAETLDVNVELGGCPPSPEAILGAIAEAVRALAGEDEDEAAPSEAEPDTTDTTGTTDAAEDDKVEKEAERDDA